MQNEQILRFLYGQEFSAASKHPQQLHGSELDCIAECSPSGYLHLCACLLRSSSWPFSQSELSAWRRTVMLMLVALSVHCSLSLSGSSVGPQELVVDWVTPSPALVDWVTPSPAWSLVDSHACHPGLDAVVPVKLGACSTQARWLFASRFPDRLATGGPCSVHWACAASSYEAIAHASHACYPPSSSRPCR